MHSLTLIDVIQNVLMLGLEIFIVVIGLSRVKTLLLEDRNKMTIKEVRLKQTIFVGISVGVVLLMVYMSRISFPFLYEYIEHLILDSSPAIV